MALIPGLFQIVSVSLLVDDIKQWLRAEPSSQGCSNSLVCKGSVRIINLNRLSPSSGRRSVGE